MAAKIKVHPKDVANNNSHHDSNHKENQTGEVANVHQTSPGCMLTFVRWAEKDTYKKKSKNAKQTLPVLVVTEDIVSVSVQTSKASFTPTVNISLRSNSKNYMTAIQPGDFVFVNILDHDMNLDRLIEQAKQLKPINGFHDGFKGFFRVTSVTKDYQISASTGTKRISYNITAQGFTEFANHVEH